MKCEQCGHEVIGGDFCQNCGALIEMDKPTNQERYGKSNQKENQDLSAEKDRPLNHLGQTTDPNVQQNRKNNNTDQVATIFSNFGHFFMTLLKQPSQAKKANHHDVYSALITMGAISLFVSITIFIPHVFMSRSRWFFPAPSIFFEFTMPFLVMLILMAGFISLTFIAVKITKVPLTYADVVGKYGAYLLPYGLLYIAGIFLLLLQIPVVPTAMIVISLVGPIFVIPAFIIYSKKGSGMDKIYTLIALYVVEILFIILISNSVFGNFLHGFLYIWQ